MRSCTQPLFLVGALLSLSLRSVPADAQWRIDGAPLCTALSNQFIPAAIPDGAGGAIVAWYDYRGSSADIYAQHVSQSGAIDPAWPMNGRVTCAASGGQYSPTIVGDGAGGAIITWQDERGSSADIYAHHLLASGAVDPGWPANGRGVCTAADDQIYPTIVGDGAGGAIITWRDSRGGPDTDIFAQRVLASGAVDPTWPANGRALCTAAGNQSVPTIAMDGAGGALVTWSDLRSGSQSDIYAQRILASGAVDPAWPTDGRALCIAAGNQSGPTIVGDGAGGAIVTWFDYRNGIDSDIYAQHLLATGGVDPSWPAGGRALCVAQDEQYSPVLVADGAGGAVATWYDYRNGAESDIYAMRVLASGTVDPSWPADGRALCTSAGDQLSPSIVSDGAGGAVASWSDYRPGSTSDIYVQHVRATGAVDPAWPLDGEALCAAAGDQYSPAIVADGAGGAIVAWSDNRDGIYSDIYAQRAYGGGGVAAVEPGQDTPWGLLPIGPIPARAGVTIRLALPTPERVTVQVLDSAGRRVRTVISGQQLPAGLHDFTWEGAGDDGKPQKSGVYWVRADAMGRSSARKLVLLR